MNTPHYLLPAAAAAAFHAVLLLALPETRSLPAGSRPSPAEPVCTLEVPLEPIALPPDASEEAPVESPPARGDPVERLAEPPEQTFDSGFEIPRPTITPAKPAWPTEHLPEMPGQGGTGDESGWGPPSGPIHASALDRDPRATVQVAPDYPFELRRQGVEGTVWMSLVVGPDGAVRNAEVARSTHREFEAPTVRAIQKWRFEPGKRHGRPVSFRMAVPVHFTLEGT